MCGLARQVAAGHSDGRMALILEGGYDLGGLARSVRACADVLRGGRAGEIHETPGVGTDAIARALAVQRRYWPI
jgi:acetoin utilization deacetylase AcuC-like enzyme